MRALIISTILFISACSGIPSFYDDNESLLAVEVRYSVSRLDCSNPNTSNVKNSIDKLALYSESKKSSDIGKLVVLMKETSDGLHNKESISPVYCNLKKKLLEQQSSDIANAIMRRY